MSASAVSRCGPRSTDDAPLRLPNRSDRRIVTSNARYESFFSSTCLRITQCEGVRAHWSRVSLPPGDALAPALSVRHALFPLGLSACDRSHWISLSLCKVEVYASTLSSGCRRKRGRGWPGDRTASAVGCLSCFPYRASGGVGSKSRPWQSMVACAVSIGYLDWQMPSHGCPQMLPVTAEVFETCCAY